MNERIKELAERATKQVTKPDGHYIVQEWQKVFAELIAQECVDIANNWEDQLENANCLSESNAVGIVAYRIARQFGVKQ